MWNSVHFFADYVFDNGKLRFKTCGTSSFVYLNSNLSGYLSWFIAVCYYSSTKVFVFFSPQHENKLKYS